MNVQRKKFLKIRKAVITIQIYYRGFNKQNKLKNAFRFGMLDPALKRHIHKKYREAFDQIAKYASEIRMQRLKEKLRQEEEKILKMQES